MLVKGLVGSVGLAGGGELAIVMDTGLYEAVLGGWVGTGHCIPFMCR